eukprot:COSAG06_NODE_1136_length_10570_cov_6.459555_6_plen_365_part_00
MTTSGPDAGMGFVSSIVGALSNLSPRQSRTRAGPIVACALVAARIVTAQNCLTTNSYDTTNGAGSCDALIAGSHSCEEHFVYGGDYAGYCDLSCGYNLYDSSQGWGSCEGYTYMCDAEMAPGGAYQGYCDFTCGHCSCTSTVPDGGSLGDCPADGTLSGGEGCSATCADGRVLPQLCTIDGLHVVAPSCCAAGGTGWDGEGGSTCSVCEAGRSDHDSDPVTQCADCAAGRFSSVVGATGECSDTCAPGTFSTAGAASAADCVVAAWTLTGRLWDPSVIYQFMVQPDPVNDRPHFATADGSYNLYWSDTHWDRWMLDDNLDDSAYNAYLDTDTELVWDGRCPAACAAIQAAAGAGGTHRQLPLSA